MATVVLSAAGAAIGGQIGGSVLGLSTAAIGRFAGALIGRSIDQRTMGRGSEVIETGRVKRLRLTGAGEGDAIAKIYGRMRVSGQVIWASEFNEGVSVTGGGGGSGGGKGGRPPTPPEPTVREYNYYVSLAIALCEGEISQVGRIWADGTELTRDDLNIRVYHGTRDQLPDPRIMAVEGGLYVPAYRGTAYVVIDDLHLGRFGNRVPQFTFEVVRPSQDGQPGAELDPPQAVRGVALLPGSGEYTLATDKISIGYGPGSSKLANVNSQSGKSDFLTALDSLKGELPACDAASLVVSWFGNDLRCGRCVIVPKVEQWSFDGANMPWHVAGLRRTSAPLVVHGADNKPLYGGTPSDWSVIQAIQALKATGKEVMYYPFILMDQPVGNQLPDPYSDADHQPPLPWRGRITLSKAPGQPGSPGGTSAAAAEVASFFGTARYYHFATNGTQTVGTQATAASLINFDWWARLSPVVYSGPQNEWSFRRFILHQAALCKAAGGVESFCIGSEMRGLTQIRGAGNSFPVVQQLRSLAADVRAILGPNTKISYAADWSEYFGYQPQDGSGDRYFNLDPLWADQNIDFIGIDNYMPLSDWRDGTAHADAEWETIYDLEYLQSNIEGGEGYDWYYATDDARSAQIRTPITDDAHDEPWIWRYKDLRGFWDNTHHNRIGGVRQETSTDWVPRSKPIRFTEYGCAAIEKGTNQPNKFLDPKSSESKLPYFSDGRRDETIQMQYLRAMNGYWREAEHNPISDLYHKPMIDMDHAYVWAYDTRPFPFFPNNRKLWSDGVNYGRGHWISGRVASHRLASVVDEITSDVGARHVDTSKLHGTVKGYEVSDVGEARAALQPLMLRYGFDAIERDGTLKFRLRDGQVDFEVDPELVVRHPREDGTLEYTRGSAAELSGCVRLRFIEADGDFDVISEEAILSDDPSPVVSASEFPLSMTRAEGRQTVERWLSEAKLNTDTVQFSLPPSKLEVGAGDVVALPEDGGQGFYRVDRVEERGGTQQLDGVRIDPESYRAVDFPETVPRLKSIVSSSPVSPFFLDLPLLTGDEVPHAPYLAVSADPWPGSAALYASDFDSNYHLNTVIAARTPIAVTESDLVWAPSGLFDRASALQVKMLYGELESVNEAALLNGANLCAIGDGTPNNWELFQFQNADLAGPETYMLSTHLRGQLGTERREGHTWPAGSFVIRLDGSPQQISLPDAKRGISRFYRIGPSNRPLSDSSYQKIELAFDGIGLRPYRPVHMRLQGEAGQDRVLSWVRRSRIGADRWETPEIPLGEEREQYIVRVVRAGQILREEMVDTSQWMYSDLAQTEDMFAAGDALQVAQVSSQFGAGSFAELVI